MDLDINTLIMDDDHHLSEMPREECGVTAVYHCPEASKLAYLSLYALQHRGQESAGVSSADGENLFTYKGYGLVNDIFTPKVLSGLPGHNAIGHVRYSTTGSSIAENAQPIVAKFHGGLISIAHNGNLTNADELRADLEKRGAIFQGTTDTEVLIHLIAQHASEDFEEALIDSVSRLKGAYSLVILREDKLYAIRDPRGFRPLCIGKLGDGYVVSSESCAFDIINAQYLRELNPGEMITFSNGVARSSRPFPEEQSAFCVFEYIYFSRPDSMAQSGKSISELRNRLGEQLAIEHPAEADVVIAVPDSSVPAAIGFARQSGIPYDIGLVRSHYIGRTFIEPNQAIRDFGARIKYNPVRSILQGKRVVIVDDSIVRGTTSRKIVNMVRDAGAREIHFRVTAPPWKNPCYFGIDTPEPSKLLAGLYPEVQAMCDFIQADTLGFISPEGLYKVMPKSLSYCSACFTGRYPDGQKPEGVYNKEILETR